MSYNWISAADAKGRERLKELMDKGERIPIRECDAFGKRIVQGAKIGNTYFIGQHGVPLSMWAKWDFEGIEFLPSEPPKPQADEDGLLPCPFCGGKAEGHADEIHPHGGGGAMWIECQECCTKTKCSHDYFEARANWNRRA